jgi:hypothetical protein
LTLYSFSRTSIFILGAVSITKNKQNINLVWCYSRNSQVTIYTNNNYYIRSQECMARQWPCIFHSIRLWPRS